MEEKKKTVAFFTLGCKLNFSESSEIGRQLEQEGFSRVDFGKEADISVIHTCSVTGSADRKTRQAIKKAIKVSPDGFVVAMGCYAQLRPEEIASLIGVDLILGTKEKFDLVNYLSKPLTKGKTEVYSCDLENHSSFYSAYSSGERTRAFLKVQDGCDYSCSYCTIPQARGHSRNPTISQLEQQAQNIASQGIREIVLSGVNIGDFGCSTRESFTDLVKALSNLDVKTRFRISSIEPNLLSDEIVDIIAQSSYIVPHFHIPLQSGSDSILKSMRRRYPRSTFEKRVRKIKSILPNACIGADVIVGFPGETDIEFNETYDFIEGLDVSYLHVFTYSERPGTPAASMTPKVTNRIRNNRSKKLRKLSVSKKAKFYQSQEGKIGRVIFEREIPDSLMVGFTENYIEVAVPLIKEFLHAEQNVELNKYVDGRMFGKLV